MKKSNYPILLFTAIALVFQACGKNTETTETGESVTVSVATVEPVSQAVEYSFTGKVKASQQTTLSTRIMGQISRVLVEEGDIVSKGQLLVDIRSKDIEAKKQQALANIAQAEANYENVKKNYERISSLYENNSATKKEFDDISAQYEITKANLESAKKALDEVNETMSYAHISAPYSGVVIQKFVHEGDMANPGMPLLAIEASTNFEVETKIPESEIGLIIKGDSVTVSIPSINKTLQGVISQVSPSNILSGHQYLAVIDIELNDIQKEKVKSGMFARVNLETGNRTTIMAPSELIVNRGQLQGIWTVSQNGAAMLRWIRLGKKKGDQVEILSGLRAGDRLITSAENRLYDGVQLDFQ